MYQVLIFYFIDFGIQRFYSSLQKYSEKKDFTDRFTEQLWFRLS